MCAECLTIQGVIHVCTVPGGLRDDMAVVTRAGRAGRAGRAKRDV